MFLFFILFFVLFLSLIYLNYFGSKILPIRDSTNAAENNPLSEEKSFNYRAPVAPKSENLREVGKSIEPQMSVPRVNTDRGSDSEVYAEISPGDITIAIFCALAYEGVAVKYAQDEEYSCRLKGVGPKKYVYSFGRIANHKVVIARPHQMGTVEAAHCATAVNQHFPNVRLALMVGIGAGIPSLPKHDIRLGDLAISIPQDGHPGVIQYDFVKHEHDGDTPKGCLNKPPPILISADGSLQEDEMMERHPLKKILQKITSFPKFGRPDTDDILFDVNFHHINKGSDCKVCEASSEKKVVLRSPRPDHQPIIHRGLILSGNGVVKDSQRRDRLRRRYNDAICFEMEAASIMDEIPCLIVRGICDYADTHKQDIWHYYAAAVAAAYCKALLRKVDHQEVEETTSIKALITGVGKLAEEVNEIRDSQSATQNTIDSMDRRMLLETLHPVKEASFDSYIDGDGGECIQGTRTELLTEVAEWGDSPSRECIFWLNGMAGTGKSTISRTVAASFRRASILGASFFFQRGAGDQGNAKRLFPTIAWQLAYSVPSLASSIKRTVENKPDITTKSIREQFNELLLQPLNDLEQAKQQEKCFVIIIDALDECEQERDIGTILQLLPKAKESKSISLRFFLTSRPELPTIHGFRELQERDHHGLILHEIPEPLITRDISLFLRHRLSKIRRKRLLSRDWPGEHRLQTLVTIAIPLFIFAATVCRFLEDLRWSPEERLDEFLSDPAIKSASQMDKTYVPILKQLLTGQDMIESSKLKEEFHEILGVIVLLARPLPINALTTFIGRKESAVKTRLESFRSVLNVPDDPDVPVRALHLSFRDFLVNTESGFRLNETKMHGKIASHCFRIMNCRLQHNICSLPSYGTQRIEIGNLIINHHLSADLQYSCRYWVYHVQQSKSDSVYTEVFSFLKKHFLHWLEVMSLTGDISETVGMIDILQAEIGGSITSEFARFLNDARKFIDRYTHIANIAPLQLYCAGLVFSPTNSVIRKTFKEDRSVLIHALPQVRGSWGSELQTLKGHTDLVGSVAFSPDGQVVASGSDDHTINLWDSKTGSELQTLKGHTGWVGSVAFSPDGQVVASGSYDHTINLWDSKTGLELQTLKGHTGWVVSVAFSPDGQVVASGSDDHTINTPDVQLRKLVDDWVEFEGEKVLWLPSDYRGNSSFAMRDANLALGYPDGKVFIIGFRRRTF
ncbi:hypothetical protein BDV32DRAFT_130723 [Aspergillus pseudonomiae]|nr:hypothetical protein BDV32DRAFT_130723 [Aspergillus pseudonomiae]